MIRLILTLSLVAGPALAQVRVHPAEIAPGQRFAIAVDATLPDPCQLDGDLSSAVQADEFTVTFAPYDQACAQVVTRLSRAFGPFRLDSDSVSPGDTVRVRVVAPSGDVGEAELSIVDEPASPAAPQPGLYWDPAFSGVGVSVMVEADSVFLAAYAYGPAGAPVWHAAQGRLNGAVAELDLLRASDGPCLVCGLEPIQAPALDPAGSITLVTAGSARAILAGGGDPGRALLLEPLGQRRIQSEGTIAGVTFSMPDLTGTWLFTGPNGEDPVTTDLAQRPTNISDSGMAWFESADETVRMECGFSPDSPYRCELFVDGQSRGRAEATGISYQAIRSPDLLGFRLD